MKSFLSIRDLEEFSKPLSVFLSQSEATITPPTSSEFSCQALNGHKKGHRIILALASCKLFGILKLYYLQISLKEVF